MADIFYLEGECAILRLACRKVSSIVLDALLPAPTIAHPHRRPSITNVVQKISTSGSLDILREASNIGTRWSNSHKNSLIGIDCTSDLSWHLGLAEAWQRIDERTVELDLKLGVRFHDARLLTAEDVVFSFSGARMFGLPGASAPAAPLQVAVGARGTLPGFERVEVLGPYWLRWINRVGDVSLESCLSHRVLSHRVGCVLSARAWQEAGGWQLLFERPIGTGHYRVVEWMRDRRLVLEAFDDYHGGRPPILQIRFVEGSELAHRINGLFATRFNFAYDITPNQIAVIERDPRFEVTGDVIMNHRLIHINTTNPVLRKPLVRRAIPYAVDRYTVVDSLWAGRTNVPPGLQFDFFGPMLCYGWATPSFDPADARCLSREAVYRGEPIPYRLLNTYYTNQVSTTQIQVEMWRTVGLNVQIRSVENWGQVWSRDVPRGLFDHSVTAFFSAPVSLAPIIHGPNGSLQHNAVWSSAEFNALMPVLEGLVDAVRRAVAWGARAGYH